MWFGGLGTFNDSKILYPEYLPSNTELGGIGLSLVAYGSNTCPNDTASMILTIDSLYPFGHGHLVCF
ncbi:MAG: hypothetical protein GY714_17280 [Desulfobacterales bacterium]|nr:hypothetical protein [Desulfobacterales bacterium]